MLPVIYGVVIWLVIPLIILGLFFFSIFLVTQTNESTIKISARAGFWTGLLFFVIHVVSELQSIHELNIKSYQFPQFNWLLLISGAVAGFIFLWGVKFFLPTRFVGLFVLILSFIGTAALFDYLFVINTRDTTLFVVLGVAAGILLHIVIFPENLKELFYPRDFPRVI